MSRILAVAITLSRINLFRYVRFTPESGHSTARLGCPLCAKADIQVAFRYYCRWARCQVRGASPVKLPRRKFLHLATSAAALPAMPSIASALDYPTRPVRLIAPFPPGGVVDLFSRLIAQPLSERLGQPVIVENRAGAGGNVGTEVAV